MSIIITWIISALAIALSAFIIPGVQVGLFSALGTALVISLVNTFIKPVLVLLTLPINILTLGLFTFVINGIVILIAGAIVPGFQVSGLLTAILFSIVLSIVNVALFSFIGGF